MQRWIHFQSLKSIVPDADSHALLVSVCGNALRCCEFPKIKYIDHYRLTKRMPEHIMQQALRIYSTLGSMNIEMVENCSSSYAPMVFLSPLSATYIMSGIG